MAETEYIIKRVAHQTLQDRDCPGCIGLAYRLIRSGMTGTRRLDVGPHFALVTFISKKE